MFFHKYYFFKDFGHRTQHAGVCVEKVPVSVSKKTLYNLVVSRHSIDMRREVNPVKFGCRFSPFLRNFRLFGGNLILVYDTEVRVITTGCKLRR